MIKLFHGKAPFLSIRLLNTDLQNTKEAYQKKGLTPEIFTFDSTEADPNSVINEIETQSLFSSNKIIIIKRIFKSRNKETYVEYFLENLEKLTNQTGTDLFIYEEEKLRSNLKILKLFKELAEVEESSELNKRSFIKWAKDCVEKEQISIDNKAINELSERSDYDPERFYQELEKLKVLNCKITEDLVKNSCPDTLESSIWNMMDNVNDGNKADSVKDLNRLITQGNDPIYILFMLARNIRMLILTKLLDAKGLSNGEIASKLKVPPFAVNKLKSSARSTSLEKQKKIYEKLATLDYSSKTGQIDLELAMSILLSVI